MQHNHSSCAPDNAFNMLSHSSDLEPVNLAMKAEQKGERASFHMDTLLSLPVYYST